MKKLFYVLLTSFFISPLAYAQGNFDINLDDIEIEYEKFELDNGLTLIVHEDHKAPIVAVNIWYHVGSKDEPEGKTGFAHLFEHLMFNGSENYNDDYFQVMESIGATDLNGTTWFDRTNYFQNVPKEAFDIALWLESDRMGHFEGAITQERLDEQRGVVQNEKRQGDNQPYGLTEYAILENSYPKGHPYRHSTIGSLEDLDAASLEDVKNWFSKYYGAANSVIVVAGDVTAEEAFEKVNKYFGNIPAGPPLSQMETNIAKRTGTITEVMQDNVPQVRYYMIWNVPEYGSKEAVYLDLASDVLSSGKNSRFYKRLVYDEQIASSVNAYIEEHEIGSLFKIVANVKPNVDPKEVEKAVKEELQKFLAEGPADKEMKRIKTQHFAGFIRGIERIGGFGGKSDILARNETYMDDAGHYKTMLEWVKDATPSDLQSTAKAWLSDGLYQLRVDPFPEYTTTGTDADRSGLPELGEASEVDFPELQEKVLSNGIKVILAERHSIPVVQMSLRVDAGYSADQFAKPGTAKLTLNMLDEGTKSRSSLEINEDLQMLGASLGTGSNLDNSFVSLNSLKINLDQSLDLFADVVMNPSFPQADFERLKKEQLVSIQREKSQPVQMALRVFPKFIYGEDHAYGVPYTGSGYETTVSQIAREDLVKFYNDWFKPNNTVIAVAGDITMEELTTKLEARFKNWKQGEVPQKNLSRVSSEGDKVYVMNRPGAPQSVIFAGYAAPAYGETNEVATTMMNNILGGEFTSRVNMNLREEKGWAYGAFTILLDAKAQRPFIVYAPVQTDKTSESMQEIVKELRQYVGDSTATEQELEKTKQNAVLALPGRWETIGSVLGDVSEIITYDLPLDYYDSYAENVRNVDTEAVHKSAEQIVKPASINWIVVGDRKEIDEKLKALDYGEIIYIDADGNVLPQQIPEAGTDPEGGE